VNARPPKKPRDLVDGVLLIDKPVGLSSNDALTRVKRIVNAKKAGHTGTLDPFATGLLPLCFGEATKFSQDLLEADKTYLATVHLGITTTTGDTEGEVLETRDVDVSTGQVEAALARFRGPILQVPPMYSALKRDGKALYEYAREGVTLEREARPVTIHELELVAIAAPFLTIRVKCSKGTYVRVLGEDIGALLGCGAHLSALRRVQVGDLGTANMVTLEELQAHENPLSLLAPVDALLSTFPRIDLTPELEKRFLNGQRLALGKEAVVVPPEQGRVRVYADGRLLGTAILQEYAILAPERLIAARQA
jgi:tRNA pseudouridine55 synthase